MTMQKRTARDFCCKNQHGMIDRTSAEMSMSTMTIAMANADRTEQGRGRKQAFANIGQQCTVIGTSS